MQCKYCHHECQKAGTQNNAQRFYCKICRKYQQKTYIYKAHNPDTNKKISILVKESCGIRSISRILKISATTVIRRIQEIAKKTEKPSIIKAKEYEMDEMRTFIKKKENKCWIAYAIRKDTKEVTDFKVGKRTTKTLQRVTKTLIMSEASKIFTDKLNIYQYIIPEELHHRNKYKINHIERKNLSIRTHLKRLSRRTICFSKTICMLEACLKIYFWG